MESLVFIILVIGFIVLGLFVSTIVCLLVSKEFRKSFLIEIKGE